MFTFKVKTGETVTLALAKREDLPEIDALASIIDYENGIRTWELYFNTNHEAWWVVRNSKNELIAYTIAHAMPNGVMMGFHVVVREDYQGMGVGRLLPPNKVPWIGNASSNALIRQFFGPNVFGFKLCHMFGYIQTTQKIPNLPFCNFDVAKVKQDQLAELAKYDEQFTHMNRYEFLKEWIFDSESYAYLAIQEGKIVGYVVLRFFDAERSKYYTICPLYAENSEIATHLFWSVIKHARGKWLAIPCLADKPTLLQLGHSLGLGIYIVEVRNASRETKNYNDSLPIQKCYACHEYWPL